jgi:hypothetical protein
LQRIEVIKITKNGLSNSIGWNLGKKYKSIHLLDPLTSTPIKGTSIKKINDIKNIIIEYLNNLSLSIEEKTKITIIPSKIKTKCLKKNE